jgi:tRNA pseudouridine55 synthase
MWRGASEEPAAMSDPFGDVELVGRDDGIGMVREGVAVLVDKPKGWSSFKVIQLLRSRSGIRKIGHAGTLDPMATGLLICCVGRSATRTIDRYMNLEKEYTGVLRLGEETASYDAESEVTESRDCTDVTDSDIMESFKQFVGEIDQIPPMYSAIKIGGRRLYKLARKGVTVDRPARRVRVDVFEFIERQNTDVRFRVVCSKGTYVRSLAHDVGQRLGVGAHLVALRRTRIGTFCVENALTTDSISAD